MDAEQLRQCAHQMVDFIADYYKTIEDFPVLSQVEPGYLSKLLPSSAPDNPASLEDVLNDVRTVIFPGVTHWQSPNYFAYFPSNSSIAGFLGEMLSAGINMVGFSWITSPAATELEIVVLDWLAKILNLPDEFLSTGNGGGVIQGTASEAILVTLIAARDRVLRRIGHESVGKLVAYGSDQTHSSLKKACQISGINPQNLRILDTDSSSNHSLSPESLAAAVSADVSAGLVPFFVCGTVGATSSCAVDPLEAIGRVARSNSMWFHVDAAYAGAACVCPEFRGLLNGVESADSFNMNAHKWMLTNFDCSALWVKERGDLVKSLSTNPEFLKNKSSESGSVVDFKDWQVPLGRRFRSLKLWMVLRMYGADGLRKFVRRCVGLARRFEGHMKDDARFEVVAPVVFSLVCFRISPPRGDEVANRKLLDGVNSTGKAFLSHTVMDGMFVLRFVVGAPLTEERHVDGAWKVITEVASDLLAE